MPAEIEQELAQSFELVAARPAARTGSSSRPRSRVDAAFLDAAGPQLRIVANYAVGLDNVDLDATRERGIVVEQHAGRADERHR